MVTFDAEMAWSTFTKSQLALLAVLPRVYMRRLLTFILIFVGFQQAVLAGGIDTVREKALRFIALSARYDEAASRSSANSASYTHYTSVDVKEQHCSVLADLLGIGTDAIADALQIDPGLDSNDRDALRLYSLSLRNYALAASSLLQDDDFSWKYKWNLNCSGVYNSQKWFPLERYKPFSLSISEDGQTLRLVGDIRPGLLDSIGKRLAIHSSIRSVDLVSRGGSSSESMKIGRLLRRRGISTTIGGNCYSGCALIFLCPAAAPPRQIG